MNRLYAIRQMIVSFVALMVLGWAFFQNALFGKLIVIPFLVSSLAILCENFCLLLNQAKLAHLFQTIFRIVFFVYFFGFLMVMIYYAFSHQEYSILIPVGVFLLFGIYFLKKSFFRHK